MIEKGDLNKITEIFWFEKRYFRKLSVLPRTSMTSGFATDYADNVILVVTLVHRWTLNAIIYLVIGLGLGLRLGLEIGWEALIPILILTLTVSLTLPLTITLTLTLILILTLILTLSLTRSASLGDLDTIWRALQHGKKTKIILRHLRTNPATKSQQKRAKTLTWAEGNLNWPKSIENCKNEVGF